MNRKIKQLFYCHAIFYLLFYELRITLEQQSFEEFASWLEFKDSLLNLSSFFVFFCHSLGAYLILYFYYPKVLSKVVAGLLSVVVLVISMRYIIDEIFYLNVFGFDNYNDKMSLLSYSLGNLFYALLHLSLGAIFFFAQYSRFKEQQEQQLLIENKKTELAYLRSQVNPHFLFNTLNNIYSLVYQKSDKALPALEKLTEMLRYSLYEGAEKIDLEKEINSIKNFIILEEIRYAYPLNIEFLIEGNVSTIAIPPFILFPLVENAFKHGDVKKPLKIHLEVSNQLLKFNVYNDINSKQKDEIGGIGLENIKKRLELIYEEQQQLTIQQTDSFFDVHLEINT